VLDNGRRRLVPPPSTIQVENSQHHLSSNVIACPLDWVRDVAWAPNTGMPYNLIASCSEDRTVNIWKQTEREGLWIPTRMRGFDSPVWRVSWSVTGNVLAVSTGDHSVTLWKQSVDEQWVQITSVEDGGDAM
jgi:protein transport protein SEC13